MITNNIAAVGCACFSLASLKNSINLQFCCLHGEWLAGLFSDCFSLHGAKIVNYKGSF